MADSRKVLEELSRKLADDGKLLEAGWVAFRIAALPQQLTADQLRAMRLAYMAGCQHLFGSMMTMMEEDREPTAADMKRMDLINNELNAFVEKELGPMLKPKGTMQ